ncbi:cytochrome b [Pseudomonas sp. MWU12-3103b]|uniref:cytochrome b n=1 Tax=Pseudomonas sp. MWU12-3103b TaxID=2928857 RepID=UPI00200038FB|nr:cytochrome b [Pseudomonas sp. MWU12-3103b]
MNDRIRPSYSNTAKALHWIMAAIFLAAWIIGFYSATFTSYTESANLKYNLIITHKSIAMTILFLALVRIFWRYTHPAPSLPESMHINMKRLAHLGHIMLYVALLILPISGCISSWLSGYPVPVLFIVTIPALVETNKTMAPIAQMVHQYLAFGAGLLIIGHVIMALKHHFIEKDGVLMSMLWLKR